MNNRFKLFFLCIIVISLCCCKTVTQTEKTDKEIKPNNAKLILGDSVYTTDNKEALEAYTIGSNFLFENKLEQAEKYLLKAIKLDANFVDAIDHLAIVYRRQNKLDKAEELYLTSLEINPNNILPYINLGMIYKYQNRFQESLNIYLEGQKIDPENPEPYYGIGELYQMLEDYKTSKEFFYVAIEKYYNIESPLIYDAFFYQGINHYQLKEFNDALECLELAIEAYPDNIDIINLIELIKGSV